MERNKPIENISEGNIFGSIWENKAKEESGERTFLVLKIDKRYRTKDGEWKSSNNYTRAEIKRLIELLKRAEEFMASYKPGEAIGAHTESEQPQ